MATFHAEATSGLYRSARSLGPLHASAAAEFIREHLIPDLTRRFDRHLSRFGRTEALMQMSLGASEFLPKTGRYLSQPRSPRPRDTGISAALYCVAARVALERTVLLTDFGTSPMARPARDTAVRVAAQWTQAALIAEIASREDERDLQDPGHFGQVTVRADSGRIHLDYSPTSFNVLEHSRVVANRILDEDPRDLETLNLLGRWMSTGDCDLPEIAELSSALEHDCNFSVMDVLAAVKIGYFTSAENEVSVVDLSEFTAMLESIGQQSIMPIRAFDSLVFGTDGAESRNEAPHLLRFQSDRLTTRPFIVVEGKLFLLRDMLFRSMFVYWRYLVSGEWPIAPADRRATMPQFHQTLARRRSSRGREHFEDIVQNTLDQAGIPAASLASGRKFGSCRTTREVDAVAVDVTGRTLWLLEAKDMFSDGTLLALRADIDEFYSDKGFIAKMSRSIREVSVDPDSVARHVVNSWRHRTASSTIDRSIFEVVGDTGDWQARGAFVVRDYSPAELIDIPFPAVRTSQLTDLILNERGNGIQRS